MQKEERKIYYQKNKKRIYASHRKYVKKNEEQLKQYRKEYWSKEENKAKRRENYRKRIKHFKERDRIHYYKTKDRHRELSMAKKYNITVEEYRNMFVTQDNKCGICKKSESAKGRVLAVDHDHKTGKVRGLLCAKCNKGLGFVKDDISLVYAIKEYLENAPPTTSNPHSPH